MIKGTKLWNDRDNTFFVQTNNAMEAIIRKVLKSMGIDRGFLHSCGPESSSNILASMGKNIDVTFPTGEKIQSGDALFAWMNDTTKTKALRAIRKDIDPDEYFGNQIPQYYPHAIGVCYGVTCRYLEGQNFDWVASVVSEGHGVMICLKSPGHYLAVVAYDDETKELIYRDPWPGRTGTDGYNLRMKKTEFDTNTKNFCVVFGG